MKRLEITLILIALLLGMFSCKPSKEEAIKYNDLIINQQISINRKIETLNKSFKNWEKSDSMDICRLNALEQVEQSIKLVSEMKDFHGNSNLRDEAISLFKIYKNIIGNEFKEMIMIYKLPLELYTKDQERKWNNLSDSAFSKMDIAISKMQEEQKKFAEEFKFEFEKEKK